MPGETTPFVAVVAEGDSWSVTVRATSSTATAPSISVGAPTGDAISSNDATVDRGATPVTNGSTASLTITGTTVGGSDNKSLTLPITATDATGTSNASLRIDIVEAGPIFTTPQGTGLRNLVVNPGGPFFADPLIGTPFDFTLSAVDPRAGSTVNLSVTGTGGSTLTPAQAGVTLPTGTSGNPASLRFQGTFGTTAGGLVIRLEATSSGRTETTSLQLNIQTSPPTYDPALPGLWYAQEPNGSRNTDRALQIIPLNGDVVSFNRTEGVSGTVGPTGGPTSAPDEVDYPNFVAPAFRFPPTTFSSVASGPVQTDRDVSVGEIFEAANLFFGTTDQLEFLTFSPTANQGTGVFRQSFANGDQRSEDFTFTNFSGSGAILRQIVSQTSLQPAAGTMDRTAQTTTTKLEYALSGTTLQTLGATFTAGGSGTTLVAGSPWTASVQGGAISVPLPGGINLSGTTELDYELVVTATEISLSVEASASFPPQPPFIPAVNLRAGGFRARFQYQTTPTEIWLQPIVRGSTYELDTSSSPNVLRIVDLADDNATFLDINTINLGLTTVFVMQFGGAIYTGSSADLVGGSPWSDATTGNELTFTSSGSGSGGWSLATSTGVSLGRGRWLRPVASGPVFYSPEEVWVRN